MRRAKCWVAFAMLVGMPVYPTAGAPRVQIGGTITTTLTIYEDAELVGDVTCQVEGAACVAFGASNITLKLNGFTIRGRIQPPTGCVTIPDFFVKVEDGISIVSQSDVAVLGPGRIENFGRSGVFALSSSAVTIKRVTAVDNCYSGIQLWTVADSEVLGNVSARNAMGSEGFACGGIWLTAGSTRVRVHKNEVGGNGSAVKAATGFSNDFGIGVVGNSTANLVEENGFGGNMNGVFLAGVNTRGNMILRNVFAGNPPIQVETTFGPIGFDIQDLAPADANVFEQNLCRTYFGAGPNPCLTLPKFGGHRNTSQGSPKVPRQQGSPKVPRQ